MPRLPLRLLAATFVFFAVMQTANAQITNAEVERGLRYPGTRAWDGDPYTQRYSYGLMYAPVHIGGDSRYLYYLDYLDRADRAEKFGYRMPVDPFFEEPVVVHEPAPVPVRTHVGFGGFGIFRRR
jgi:hypothetical protein